uniref:Phospholipid:diacylglycerol acyltransferase n=1 Tax=Paramoeba aestuarina TaxID=180227 RepID=A0A7S4K8A7_9EUKA
MGDQQRSVRTVTQLGTWEPKWKFPAKFIYKKGESFFRDLEFEVFVAKEKLSQRGSAQPAKIGKAEEKSTKLGLANFMVEGSEKATRDHKVPLVGLSGKIGDLYFSVSFETVESENKRTLMDEYTHYDVMEQVRTVKKKSGEKRLGRAMSILGYKPYYPIVIVPGLASSALEAWYTEQGIWKRSRVWIDPMKIGQTAGMQKFSNKFTSKKKKSKDLKEDEEEEEEEGRGGRRKWLHMMMPSPTDGWSDPPGIKVRAVEGLHGIDYLAESAVAKKSSYVFGHVINALIDVGYDNINLQAASYDWRLPPSKLQKRDFYFTRLRDMVRTARNINEKKVVLMGHSMGCRCIQYFLSWCEGEDPGFVRENVHAFLAMGPPFLGAPKAMRAVLTGDCMGLEMFLTPEEAVVFSRACGSSPWLYPVDEQQFPDVVARVSGESQNKNFQPKTTTQLAQTYASVSNSFKQKYYDSDPYYLLPDKLGKKAVLSIPPVSNLWVIMGVNLPTEVSYYYKVEKKSTKGQDAKLVLDSSADKYSNKKDGMVNPRGLQISGGMAFETRSTYQPTVRMNKSGDGTIPFCSLNYAHFWKKKALENKDLYLDVQIVEVEGAEHREMLTNEAVLKAIIEFTCKKF